MERVVPKPPVASRRDLDLGYRLTLAFFVIAPTVLVAYKLLVNDYSLSFGVLPTGRSYRIDPELQVPARYPSALSSYLVGSEAIQVDSPEVLQTLRKIGADEGPLLHRIQKIYDLTSGFPIRPFKGMTDALTALRLGEASCNGKSRRGSWVVLS